MGKKGSKKGLLTKKEIKFFTNFLLGKIKVKGLLGKAMKWLLPSLLDKLDDNFGDRLPEPWQTFTEEIFTKLYMAMRDKVISDEEAADMIAYCEKIINEKIDLPMIGEDGEAVIYMTSLKTLSSYLRKALKG